MEKDTLCIYFSSSYSSPLRETFEKKVLSHAFANRPVQLLRLPSRKPVLSNEEAHISLSHSENVFVFALCHSPVGIDVQKRKKLDSKAIAQRFFTKAQAKFVEKDEDNFFTLFCRFEALAKLRDLPLAAVLGKEDATRGKFSFFEQKNFCGDFFLSVAAESKIQRTCFFNIDEI